MHRITAIAGLALAVSVAWFSAGRTLEIPTATSTARSPSISAGKIARFQSTELTNGEGTLKLPAGNESYLIIASSESDSLIAQLAIFRTPPNVSFTNRWRDASISVEEKPDSNLVFSSGLKSPDNGVTDEARKMRSSEKPEPFFLHVTEGPLDDPRQYATVHARVIDESEHLRILLDKQEMQSERIAVLARRIRNEFEQVILPVCTPAFGIWRDVDGDGKLTILLSPWLNRLQGGKTSLNGFVRGTDFDERIPAPLGNRCDAIYLNSNLSATVNLRSLLGHEYFHVLQCGLRGYQPGFLPLEEDWLNEAEAHLAEQWLGGDDSNLKHRIDSFLTSPGTAPLVVRDYYRAGLWRDDGCRGATFLFLRWCAGREGDGFLQRLLRSPETGTQKIESIMGTPFQDLHRQWAIEMLSAAIAPQPQSNGASTTAELSQKKIPWEKLELISLPESNDPLRISLAPSAVRFFKIPAANRETCLRIAADSNIPLQLTLIESGQLGSFRSSDEKVRLDNIATGLDDSIESFR